MKLLLLVGGAALAILAGQDGHADAVSWPVRPEAVAFAFPTALVEATAFEEPGAEPLFAYRLERRGLARVAGTGALDLGYGTAIAPGQGAVLPRFLASSDGLSVEARLTRAEAALDVPASILTLGDPGAPDLQLLQEARALVLRLRVDGRDEPVAVRAEPADAAPVHVVAVASADGVLLYLDGEPAARAELDGWGLAGWRGGELVFGSGGGGRRGWPGRVEGVVFHTEALSAADVRASAEAYAARVAARPAPIRHRLQARLLAKSRVATPDEIAPYRESLAVFEYEVVRVLEGFYPPKRIRVAHWVILGGTALPFGELDPGEVVELEVEPFAANPQLDEVHFSDTLELDFDLELNFDAGGASVERPE